MTFGEFLKGKRLEKGLGLREFCELAEMDASNWSKIERGRLAPPSKRDVLERVAKVVGFKKGSDDWLELFNLASVAQGRIPESVYEDEEIVSKLPVFFRTISGKQHTQKELDELIRLLKQR